MGNDQRQEEQPDLTVMDEIARGFIARAAPVRYSVARSPEELDAIFRLRYEVIVAQGWADSSDFPDGRERNADDARAVHLAGWDGSNVAVSARLIFPSPDHRLPTEEVFGLDVEPRGQVVNVDRLIVAPAYSGRQHRLLLGLLGQTWLTARAGGCNVWVGIDSPGMIRLYRVLGFEGTALAPARLFWGEERVPFRFDGVASARNVIARWASTATSPAMRDAPAAERAARDASGAKTR